MPAASLTSSMLRCEILKPGLPCTGVQIYVLGMALTRGNVTLPGMNIRGGSTTVPSAGYADLPPDIGFEPRDEPLRKDHEEKRSSRKTSEVAPREEAAIVASVT